MRVKFYNTWYVMFVAFALSYPALAADKADEKKLPGGSVEKRSTELSHDDGKSAGKMSIAGSGHAVRFTTPGDSGYVTEVRIYGSRYGMPNAPKENFHVWLCDKDFKVIADNELPYSKFQRGNPRWVALKIKPARVPKEFIICAGFNPEATKGVYVHYDGQGGKNSLEGLPGEEAVNFEKGNWMIRAKVADKADAD